jgi:hypothetical protein
MILSAARPASGCGLMMIAVKAPLWPTSNRGCPNVLRPGNGHRNINRVRFRTAVIISIGTGFGQFRRYHRVRVYGYSARRITRSRPTAETSPFTSLSASIPTIACMFSISGASRRRRIDGLRPSRTLSFGGSPWAGPKKPVRSAPASGLGSIGVPASEKRSWRAKHSQPVETKASGRRAFEAAPRSTVCISPPTRHGARSSRRSYCRFPRAGMMTSSMLWVWSDSFSMS